MISIVCDVCMAKCDLNRISISDIELVMNSVGEIMDSDVDLCSVTCLVKWLNEKLQKHNFLSAGHLEIICGDHY